ncbi:MAG: AraC family transcriptional regulator [Victivallaceae bacterium]|jgi:AraC-like DNA-binding protein
MNAEFEYFRTGQGTPDPQLLGVSSAEGFFFFRIQTFHLSEAHRYVPQRMPGSHAHNVFHLVFYTADNERNSILLDGAETETLPGTLVMTSPGEPHSFQALMPGKTVYHELTFNLENETGIFCGDWNQLMAYYAGEDNVCIPSAILLDDSRMAVLDKHFQDLGSLLKDLSGNMLPVLKNVTNIFEFLYSEVCMEKDSIRKENALDKVKYFIEKHYSEDLSLKDLGRRFFMSPEHLCRKFKAAYGVAPLKYALELKIAAAKNMLLHSEQSIKEISGRLGFSDVYAFSKSFRKNTGIPPGKYRESGN